MPSTAIEHRDPPPAADARSANRDAPDWQATVAPSWMSTVLLLGAAYNLLWGAFVIFFPNAIFDWLGAVRPNYPGIWQCVGMIVGVYGIGYACAATAPYTHWPIVLVGLLGKIFGPIGFLLSATRGEFPWAFGATILTNDLIWWVPFTLILRGAWRAAATEQRMAIARDTANRDAILRETRTSSGGTLAELSRERPLMLVFLRHTGCTFCVEAAHDLARQQAAIRDAGVELAPVLMSDAAKSAAYLRGAGLVAADFVSDPSRRLYRAFGLARGSAMQLFGPRVWARGVAATLRGNWIGPLDGDGLQLGGVFVLHRGQVVFARPLSDAADRPDYAAIARQASQSESQS